MTEVTISMVVTFEPFEMAAAIGLIVVGVVEAAPVTLTGGAVVKTKSGFETNGAVAVAVVKEVVKRLEKRAIVDVNPLVDGGKPMNLKPTTVE